MGCRQSKQSSGKLSYCACRLHVILQLHVDHWVAVPLNLPPSSSDWLAQIGLQQYSAAFYAAGYGDTDTLAGLSRKHINEISLFQKGGIPSPHIKLLLDASKQFCHGYHSSSQQSQLVQQNSSAKPAQPLGTHGNVQYQPALQTPATGRLHGTELADTVSSYTSAGSFDSGYDTEDTATQSSLYSTAQLAQSTTSGLEASTNTRDQSLVARRSTAGNGPSQQHLQQLYAEVQEDYKRLQQLHPASGRLRADIRSPAPPPKRSGLSHAGHLQSAVLVKHAKKGPVQAASSGHVSKAVGEGSAAQMVKQMRKSKSAQRDEPFVHVYTNFHTLSKVVQSNLPRCCATQCLATLGVLPERCVM